MKCFLFKLIFTTPVCFNQSNPQICSDTGYTFGTSDLVFAALCSEGYRLFGNSCTKRLLQTAEACQFFVTSLFPFSQDNFYLPCPVDATIPANYTVDPSFIPSSDFLAYRNTQELPLKDASLPFIEKTFQVQSTGNLSKQRIFYPIYYFKNRYTSSLNESDVETGLYFMVKTDQEDLLPLLTKIMESLQSTGIGSKRGLGYGQFISTLQEKLPEDLLTLMNMPAHRGYITLACILPTAQDLENGNLTEAQYHLRTAGSYSNLKDNPLSLTSKPLVMFTHGSYFKKELTGDIIRQQREGSSRIYYGKPFMVGV